MKKSVGKKYTEITLNIEKTLSESRTCSQRIQDILWLKNPNYFYIVCITEYIGFFKRHPVFLVVFRLGLCLAMGILIFLNIWLESNERLYFAIMSLVLTTIAIIM